MINPTIPTKGAALLIFVVLFLVASTILVMGIGRGTYQSLMEVRVLHESKRSMYAAESGIEDAIYRHRDSRSYGATESFTLEGIVVTVERDLVLDTFEFVASAVSSYSGRKRFGELVVGDGASFNFGLQSGNGGIYMENNSSVRGNVFSNGSVRGANNNIVYGDIISAGPSGLAQSVRATSSVWAHTITSSIIDRDAYYYSAGTITGSSVGGNQYPGTPDQATATMPIPDAQIDEWKADALAGGLVASTSPQCSGGEYTIDSDTTIGPIKIECDLTIEDNSTDVYLKGAVWVAGDIDIKNEPYIRVHASSSGKSIALIADNESDRLTSSKIVVQNNAIFYGYGANSFILLISQNESNETGGGEEAINVKNNATGALLVYAAHGEVVVENGTSLKSITGYLIHTKNNAQIIYETGLMSLLFTGGPGGGYVVSDWQEH